jgi:hypothetical protein
MNNVPHWGYGTGWGIARGAAGSTGLAHDLMANHH